MKLLTLNTHSLIENDYLKKLNIFADFVVRQMPNIVILQEVMQPANSKEVLTRHSVAGKIPLRAGNHALNVLKLLKERGVEYHLIWLGIKKGYDQFDEGLAILTLEPYEDIDVIQLSPFDDYNNWKTRKALGVKAGGFWIYNVHMGWWDDKDSPFQYELSRLYEGVIGKELTLFAGDFNTVDNDAGYDLILKQGLWDTYSLAKEKDDGKTASLGIDGWGQAGYDKRIRIDYVFSSKPIEVHSSYTVFNGRDEPTVSDHCGILLNFEVT